MANSTSKSTSNLYKEWLADASVPVQRGSPCFTEEWIDRESTIEKGLFDMHGAWLSFRGVLSSPGQNPTKAAWRELVSIDYSTMVEAPIDSIAGKLLEKGHAGVGNRVGDIRQFFMNLAVSDPNDPLQLMNYYGSRDGDKSRECALHLGFDVAVELLHCQKNNSLINPDLSEEIATQQKLQSNTVTLQTKDDLLDSDSDDTLVEVRCPSITEFVEAMISSVHNDAFMIALQDVGKQKAGRKKGMMTTYFPLLEEVAKKMQKAAWGLENASASFLPKNTTTRKMALVNLFTLYRKKEQISNVRRSESQAVKANFCKGSNKCSDMYVFSATESGCSGVRPILNSYLVKLQTVSLKQTTMNRTPNDALRVASIMLDEKYMVGVAQWLSNTRNRQSLDLQVNPNRALTEAMVKDFNDLTYHAKSPELALLVDFSPNCDPNEVISLYSGSSYYLTSTYYFLIQIKRIKIRRDAIWFEGCFNEYWRPKYRQALNRWSKNTGNGGGNVVDFNNISYTTNAPWIAWIFFLDNEKGGLLQSCTAGVVPTCLRSESGATNSTNEDMDHNDAYISNPTTYISNPTTKRKRGSKGGLTGDEDIEDNNDPLGIKMYMKHSASIQNSLSANISALSTVLTGSLQGKGNTTNNSTTDRGMKLYEKYKKVRADVAAFELSDRKDDPFEAKFLATLSENALKDLTDYST